MSDRLTPTNIAKRLDVSVSTVRRLTGEYADWLSSTATPRPGGTRIYTEQDVEVLAVIVAMRQDGAPEDEIVRAIESGIIPSNVVANVAPPLPQPTTTLSVDVAGLQSAIDAQTAALARLASAEEASAAAARFQAEQQAAHVDALQEHARAMDRLSDRLVWIVVALVAIVLITVAVAVGWIG